MVFFAIGDELELIYVHELESFDGAWLNVNGMNENKTYVYKLPICSLTIFLKKQKASFFLYV